MPKCIVCGEEIPATRKDNSKYCSLKCLRKTDTSNTYKRISDNSHSPNHHKQADLGLISLEELQGYLKQPPTEAEKQKMKDRATDTVARAIFGG